MKERLLPTILALALAAGLAASASEVVLKDGRTIEGEVSRDGDNYVITLESGDVVVLPMAVVEEVRLASPRKPRYPQHPGLVDAEPETLAGQDPPDGPTGLRDDGPSQLAGQAVAPPSTREQLNVLGPPSEFRKNIVDPTWVPESDWDMDPANNNFAPSTWAEDVIEPDWQPESAFDKDRDVLDNSRSTFRKSIIDSTWQPADGFKKNRR